MLEDLYAGSIIDSSQRALTVTISDLEKTIASLADPIDAFKALSGNSNIQVIAEIKRASPSKGFLADIPDPAALGKTYEAAGASAISVLTESRKFKGTLADLFSVKAAVNVPVLRKDFIANEYQVLEARANGADMVLLIAAGLNDPQLAHLNKLINDLGMTALVETHNAEEIERAGAIGAKLVGINARDLSTFETNRDLFAELAALLPANAVAIAESAVRNVQDVRDYAKAGATAVLVGEALVTGDASSLIHEFITVPTNRI